MNSLTSICRILPGLFIFLTVAILPGFAFPKETNESQYADKVIETYFSWDVLEMEGKINLDGLPLRPTAKIYMQRGNLVCVSIRVPFLGELGRVEIEGENITAINKTRKIYCTESISKLKTDVPFTVNDVQDLLLARVFLIGSGTLSHSNLGMAEVMEYDPDNWYILPEVQPSELGMNYGFNLDADGRLRLLYASDDNESTTFSAEYSYSRKNTGIDFLFAWGSKQISAGITLGKPDTNATRPTPIALSGKYRRVGISEFLKSF